jgi:pimeloyl-ACP methyl ester carboxylesterase
MAKQILDLRGLKFSRRFAFCILLVAAVLAPGFATAQQRWLTLPPTPKLPKEYAISGIHTLQGAGVRLWYEIFGPEDKPVVVLLHGGAANSNYFGHLVRDLMRDYRVFTLDSRGQGHSVHDLSIITYEQMARDVISLLDYHKVKEFAVVGWSDGANTGFYLALQHPERVTALAAFAGNATPAGYQPSTNPEMMTNYIARARNEYLKINKNYKLYAEMMAQLSVMWRTLPALTKDDFAAIKTRTAVLHAEHDEIIRRAHSEEIAKQIPNAKFVLLRGVSHFALIQDPKRFNEAVRAFLDAR